jgi:very-short-patch-repair endonuclease
VPLLGFCIADFLAVGRRLVVEVDGAYHADPVRLRADALRDRRLQKAGYRVLRFAAADVLGEPERVRALVVAALAERARAGRHRLPRRARK